MVSLRHIASPAISRAALVVVGVLAGLLLLEGLLRLSGPVQPAPAQMGSTLALPDTIFQADETLGWRNRPGASILWTTRNDPPIQSEVTINSLGLRDAEHSYARPPDSFRVLILGDSFVEAPAVREEETAATILEAHLNSARPEVLSEVLNAGVYGYGTDQEVLFYEIEGLKYTPDVVLLAFCICNDLEDISPHLTQSRVRFAGMGARPGYFTLDTAGELVWELVDDPDAFQSPETSWAGRVDASLKRVSVLYRRLQVWALDQPRRRFTAAQKPAPVEDRFDKTRDSPELLASLTIVEQLFLRLRADVEAHGGQFAVVLVPDPYQVMPELYAQKYPDIPNVLDYYDLEKPDRYLLDILTTHSIPYLYLLPAFRELPDGGRSLYLPLDLHWGVEGNRVVGDILFEWLQQGINGKSTYG